MSIEFLPQLTDAPYLAWEQEGQEVWQRGERPAKYWLTRRFETAQGVEFQVAVGIVRGARPGPVFTNIAGQHGMEHVGPIVLRDFFNAADPNAFAGDLFICPTANPLAVELDFEFYPEHESPEILEQLRGGGPAEMTRLFGHQRREDQAEGNMNRVWRPWRPSHEPPAGMAEQIADWLWKVAVAPADMVIDHHGLKGLKPLIYAEEPALPWTPFLGIEAVWSTGPMPDDITIYRFRRLALQACAVGKVGICIEYSVQHGIKDHERPLGLFALQNMMRALGMLEGKPVLPRDVWLVPSGGGYWINGFQELEAAVAGHPHFFVDEYQPLRAGDTICQIRDVYTHEVVQTLSAPADGLMLFRQQSPLTRPGKRVCAVHTDARLMARAGDSWPVPPFAGSC